jgi:2-polyprenyl-3-methyl-5-hydroxy-6-metoxy-1,4-benzoquinol methylase
VVFAGEIIGHLFYTEEFLEELHRILKPDGTLILSTPNLVSWANPICLIFGW